MNTYYKIKKMTFQEKLKLAGEIRELWNCVERITFRRDQFHGIYVNPSNGQKVELNALIDTVGSITGKGKMWKIDITNL